MSPISNLNFSSISTETLISFLLMCLIIGGWLISFDLGCFSILFYVFGFSLIFLNTIEISIIKRKCFATCYFAEGNFLYNVFQSKSIISLLSAFTSVFFATIFFYNLALSRFDEILIYAIDFFIIVYLLRVFEKHYWYSKTAKSMMKKRIVVLINTVILTITLFFYQYYSTPPSYLQNGLVETLESAIATVNSDCYVNQFILKLVAQYNALSWWTVIKLDYEIDIIYLNNLLWILFMIGGFLMSFAFSKIVVELFSMVKKSIDEKGISSESK